MKIVKYDKFLETALSIPLLKTIRNGKERGNTLVDKLEDPNPKLKLNNDKVISIDKENAEELSKEITTRGKYDSNKAIKTFLDDNARKNRYLDVIEDEDGDKYKLNQFKKDTDFGSSGAGINTRNYENLQCIYLAHKLVRPDVPLDGENIVRLLEEYNDSGSEIAKKIHLHIPNSEKVDDYLFDALNSPEWVATLKEVTNDLYDFTSRNVRLFSKEFTGKYHVYHISCKEAKSPFRVIANKFKQLLAKSNLESNLKIEFSKYCPADVMVSVDDYNVSDLIKDVENIDDMTKLLSDLFRDRILIPISLKKVGVTVKDVKTYSIIVNNEIDRPLPEFNIESFVIYNDVERGISSRIKVSSTWKDAKNVEFDGEDRILTIDSANTSNKLNVDGEVEGKFSRHGKISFNYMRYFINSIKKTIDLQEMDEYSDLVKLNENDLINKIEDIFIKIEDISNRSYKIGKSYSRIIKVEYPKKYGTNISTGRPIGGDNRKNKLISKLQSLQIVLAIMQIRIKSVDESDEVMNKIMRYALSIKADLFETPRYVRVI